MSYLIQTPHLKSIVPSDITKNLETYGYTIVRGLFNPDEIYSCLEKIRLKFQPENDRPTIGESPRDVQTNFQKILVGGKTQSQDYLTRFFRVYYNPLWAEDIFGMHKHYLKIIHLRNLLMNKPPEYGTLAIEPGGLWSACRIHHYPIGGGFMSPHRDYILTNYAREQGLDFYQVVLNLSKKGVDYHQGGAYVIHNKEKINLDDFSDYGDLIIYDGASFHGVEEIDPHKKLFLGPELGRLVSFATLYYAKKEENFSSTINDQVEYDYNYNQKK
jgi:hypothetical protein